MPGPESPTPPGPFARLLLVALRGYKILLSPLFAGSCRFTPSCADYTAEAIRVHGAVVGVRLGAARIARCHPWGPWGFDPVPRAPDADRPRGRTSGASGAQEGGDSPGLHCRRRSSDEGSRPPRAVAESDAHGTVVKVQ